MAPSRKVKQSKLAFCPSCGKSGQPGLLRCPRCGQPFQGKRAGKQLKVEITFAGGSLTFRLE